MLPGILRSFNAKVEVWRDAIAVTHVSEEMSGPEPRLVFAADKML